MAESDKVFAGSIPKFYDTLIVPLILRLMPPNWRNASLRSRPTQSSKQRPAAEWLCGRWHPDSRPMHAMW